MNGHKLAKGAGAHATTKNSARAALEVLMAAALILGLLGAFPGPAVLALEDSREEPYPEVEGPSIVRISVAPGSDREEPFPEVGRPMLVSLVPDTGAGVRYTDVSAFYAERLREQLAKPFTDVSAFYVEKQRSRIALGAALDPLLGAVGLDLNSLSLPAVGAVRSGDDSLPNAVLVAFRKADALASVDPLLGAVLVEFYKADALASVDPLLGAVLVEFHKADALASGDFCPIC